MASPVRHTFDASTATATDVGISTIPVDPTLQTWNRLTRTARDFFERLVPHSRPVVHTHSTPELSLRPHYPSLKRARIQSPSRNVAEIDEDALTQPLQESKEPVYLFQNEQHNPGLVSPEVAISFNFSINSVDESSRRPFHNDSSNHTNSTHDATTTAAAAAGSSLSPGSDAFHGNAPHPLLTVHVSHLAQRNRRDTMEDFVTVFADVVFPRAPPSYQHHRWGWFSVCDGHGGPDCGEFIGRHLFDLFAEAFVDADTCPPQALAECLDTIIQQWDKMYPHANEGTCVTVVLVDWTTQIAYIMNLGDSKACLWPQRSMRTMSNPIQSRATSTTISSVVHGVKSANVDLDSHTTHISHGTATDANVHLFWPAYQTTDHDPANPLEVARLYVHAQAKTAEEQQALITRRVAWNGQVIARVKGALAVSRAVGNNGPLLKGCVIREPDIDVLPLQKVLEAGGPGCTRLSIVIASDGLWDNFLPRTAELSTDCNSFQNPEDNASLIVVGVGRLLHRHPHITAEQLLQRATRADKQRTVSVGDNISSIVIHVDIPVDIPVIQSSSAKDDM